MKTPAKPPATIPMSVPIILLLTIISPPSISAALRRNNACTNLEDYETIHHNCNCWHNPDVGSSPMEIITRYNYPFESYEVAGGDGFILALFRIPHDGKDVGRKRHPVFLQHGFVADSSSWLLQGRNSSIFVLVDGGYDVWIPNSRGSKFSERNTRYHYTDPKYWDYSFQEMALDDLPALLDFVVGKTGQKVTFLGHSMGSCMGFIYASLNENADKNIERIIAMAPVTTMHYSRSILSIFPPLKQIVSNLFSTFGFYGMNSQQLGIIHEFCPHYPFIYFCTILTASAGGINPDEFLPETLSYFWSVYPETFTLKTFKHFAQLFTRDGNGFDFFDYGPAKNLKIYNNTKPPEFPLERIKIPVHIFYGDHDFFASEEDNLRLSKKLGGKTTLTQFGGFDHMNFLFAKRSNELFGLFINIMKENS